MKRQIMNTIAVLALIAGTVSCKEAKNETEAKEAQEVATVVTAVKYKVDTAASTIAWVGSKPTEDHKGTINIDNGVVKVEGEKISGTFLIDMKSITVTDLEAGKGKENLEGHLKGEAEGKEDHFFNVAKYPTAAFEITDVIEQDGKKMMQGNLTIRDQKKNIEFPVTYGVDGDVMTLSTEPFTIDRTEWGVNYGSKSVFDNLGDKFISDDIQLTINLKATKA